MNRKPHCLNCDETVSQKFCPNCGQKTDTHRISLKHFFAHDIIHGMWHFEKGILFTLKEAILRPGQAALDYISGKRVRYYNVFYLSLLMVGLNVLLLHLYQLETVAVNDATPNVTRFFKENVKFILLGIVPVLGLSGFLVFRRLKLNLAEHFIIGGMCLLGMIQATILFCFTDFLTVSFSYDFFGILEVVTFFLILLFPLWCYYNAVKKTYTFFGALWRIVVFYLLVLVQIQIILGVIIYILTGGKPEVSVNL